MTTYPTITRFGTLGNTGYKAAEERFSRSGNRYMLRYGNITVLYHKIIQDTLAECPELFIRKPNPS